MQVFRGKLGESLAVFLAKLAWADGRVTKEEIDHVMNKIQQLDLDNAANSRVLNVLSAYQDRESIVDSYKALSRGIKAVGMADNVLAKYILELLSADGTVSTDEGQLVDYLNNIGKSVKRVKNVLYPTFVEGLGPADKGFPLGNTTN